jgi:hypothetical protein
MDPEDPPVDPSCTSPENHFGFSSSTEGFFINSYGSSNKDGLITTEPPSDPDNLAALSELKHDLDEGEPEQGALRVAIPFDHGTGQPAETASITRIFAAAEDLSCRTLSLVVLLEDNPNGCTVRAQAWSTSMGTTPYEFRNGETATLALGGWVRVEFPLVQSANSGAVNQVGVNVISTGCEPSEADAGALLPTVLYVDSVDVD